MRWPNLITASVEAKVQLKVEFRIKWYYSAAIEILMFISGRLIKFDDTFKTSHKPLLNEL